MTCRERILSNEYTDIIVNFVLPDDYEYGGFDDYCRHVIHEDLQIYYINRAVVPEIRYAQSSYSFIPKCYGIVQEEQSVRNAQLDTLSLADAGILAVQKPPLNLTGKNVVIGFIDTGERVIIMSD